MAEPRPIHPRLFVHTPDGPRLLAGQCDVCGRPQFPAGTVCPYCGAAACHETTVGPAGRLWLFTAVTSRPPGYEGPLPYGFGVVELEGGLRVVTRLTEARLDRLRAGMPMHLVLEPLATDSDGTPVVSYAFAPSRP